MQEFERPKRDGRGSHPLSQHAPGENHLPLGTDQSLLFPEPIRIDPQTLEFVQGVLSRPPSELWSDLFTALLNPPGALPPERHSDLIRVLLSVGALDLQSIASDWDGSPANRIQELNESIRISIEQGDARSSRTRTLLALRLQECANCHPQDGWILEPGSISPHFAVSQIHRDSSHSMHRILSLSLILPPDEATRIGPFNEVKDPKYIGSPHKYLAGFIGKMETSLYNPCLMYQRCFELSHTLRMAELCPNNVQTLTYIIRGDFGPGSFTDNMNTLMADLERELEFKKAEVKSSNLMPAVVVSTLITGVTVAFVDIALCSAEYLFGFTSLNPHGVALTLGAGLVAASLALIAINQRITLQNYNQARSMLATISSLLPQYPRNSQ